MADLWDCFGFRGWPGDDPVRMLEGAWQITWREGFEFADPERDDVTVEVKVAAAGVFELSNEIVRMSLPPFLLRRMGGIKRVEQAVTAIKLGEMATEEETDNHKSEEEPGLGGSAAQSEGGQKDKESINPNGTKGNRKEISTGESSGKAGGSRQGTQGTKEGRNKDRTNPGNSEGAVSKKVRVMDTRRRLAEIDKRTAEYKARLIEEMMTGNEEGSLQEEPRDERRTDREGTTKTREGQKAGKEDPDNSVTGEASSSEGGLKKIVSSLARALNKNQGYLADAKKKLTFDGANIMQFMIDYENLEAELVGEIIWDQRQGRGPQTNFILENDGRDRVNASTRLGTAGRRINHDTVMEEVAGSSEPQAEPEAEEPEKVYGKPREEEPADKVSAATKMFRYQIPILSLPEMDDTISKLLGTMVSVSFQTMLQASPRLLKGLRQLLTRRRVEIGDNPELPEGKREEEVPQEVANLQRSRGDLEDLEKAFADIRLSLPDREGGEVMRSPPGTKLSFHALPVRKLKIQIGSHHTDALVDEGAEITLIRRDFATITGCTVNKEVTRSICGAGGEISFAGKIPEGSVRKYKPVGKKAKPVSILLETSKEEAVEKEEEVLRVIRERRATEGHRIPDEVADTMKIGIDGFLTEEENRLIKRTCQESHLAFAFRDLQKGRLDAKLIPPVRIHTVEHECWNDKGTSYEFGIAGEDIKDLLRRFLVYNIMASGQKSILAVPEITILGFSCGAYGRKPDPAKTDKISQWPTPLRTATEVRAFLGVVGFWRIFIKNFAKIVEPIRAMIREEGTMDWTEEREGVVQRLKDILTSETVTLFAPCFNDEVGRPFILETDGGPLAVGGVLIQRDEGGKERPIRFESRTLNSAERRYSQFKKEVLAILHCLKTFQAYLFGRRFILRIHPTNVAGALKNYRPIDPTPIDAFLEYEGGTLAVDNEMISEGCTSGELLIQTLQKGAPAVVAELREGPVTTRGRREENDSWKAIIGPKEKLIAMAVEGGRETVMSLVESWERKELQWVVNQMQEGKDGGKEGEEFFYVQSYKGLFREIGLLLVGNKQPTEVSIKAREEVERYVLRGGHLFRREEGAMPKRVVCGRSRQEDVIQATHDGLTGGHRSSKGTLAKITPLYYWPGMAAMVAIYCQTCLICQERSSVRVFEPLRPTRVLGPGHLVHLDLAVMPVSKDGYRYILDARDNLSGFVEAVALKKKTGRSVADWIEDFYLRHPFVRRFIADNGTEFVNQEVLGMLKRLCVPIKLIKPYHPEANAPVERGHRTLKNTIAKLAADHLGNWPRYLKQAVFAENMTPKRTTGCIPAELWYGREIDFPVEALVPTWNRLDNDPQMTTEELIEARYHQILKNEEVMEDIASRVLDSRMRDKAIWYQVKNVRKEPLQVGEMVLLRNSALESTWSG
ncbi:hypothetical protein CBR_g22929 [Chara braunii]|uniref:Integrase catalytic domain-containing protein n=1 Tax=Chara braunii TaxID=69332 RepID=A0A388L322_CHABU|nr:hypothetical protein CBR_g22929 [Chara braunii]|eukprot:GBG76709.1 hypothetical protein CBR_g22929 [Chara braunii]